jgi:hypothetical protein
MIINQDDGLIVPDNTIAVFPITPSKGLKEFDLNDLNLFLKPLNTNHQRDWFTSHFYKCLPLSIGNMQGFIFSIPYTIDIFWNGGINVEDLTIKYYDDSKKYNGTNFIYPTSEFGSGILTVHYPVTLKTPPGINLMTISPPNFPLPGISPMTGVVESDNIRFSFTLNLKIDIPNTTIRIIPNTPIAGIIPIPRYFCDSFELKSAYDIFDKIIVEDEKKTVQEHSESRTRQNVNGYNADKIYYFGKDIRGNEFKDHQLPKKKKI